MAETSSAAAYADAVVLSIKNSEADRLARELAQLTGASVTEVVVTALRANLELERLRRQPRGFADIQDRVRSLPVLDSRSPEEIIGYDGHGLPT